MLTVKIGHYADPNNKYACSMTIYECDSIEVLHGEGNNPDSIRMTWFAAANPTADSTYEKLVIMDSKSRFGPAVVFVENSVGKTVQRITADKPYDNPPPILGEADVEKAG